MMSRTYKDKPYRIRHPRVVDYDVIEYQKYYNPKYYSDGPYWYTAKLYLKRAGVHQKKPKRVDTEDHWMTTPGWWIRLAMTKPQRRRASMWERKVLFEDLELCDPPGVSRKPHQYYW